MKKCEVPKDAMITETKSLECNVCNYHNCIDCYYYDSSYHGGYCDKHSVDTTPGNSCGSWIEN